MEVNVGYSLFNNVFRRQIGIDGAWSHIFEDEKDEVSEGSKLNKPYIEDMLSKMHRRIEEEREKHWGVPCPIIPGEHPHHGAKGVM